MSAAPPEPRASTQRFAAATAAALLAGPAALAALGGRDLDLAPAWRVSWFDALPLSLAFAVALAALCVRPAGGRSVRAAGTLAAGCSLVAALVAWTGGVRSGPLSISGLGPPAVASAVLLALSMTRGARPALSRWNLAPVAVGAAVAAVALAADRRDLDARIAAARPPVRGPDVVLVVADTLRADALGVYGASPSPTPFLDAFAARSVRFERAIAQAPWTVPSMWALMTSRHPSTLDPGGRGASDRRTVGRRPDDALPRLASELRRLGWHTAGFQKNPFLGAGSGFEGGFDVYERVGGDTAEHASAAQLVDAVLAWARAFAHAAAAPRPPFFLYVHFMDPHADYQPPRAFLPDEAKAYRGPVDGSASNLHDLLGGRRGGLPEADVSQLRSLYRGDVAYLDHELARLFESLTAAGLLGDDTLVVFTADHGEQFGEHGEFEHGAVQRENVHVPLLLRGAGLAPRVVPDVVRLVDVAPTLLDLAGAPGLAGAEGRSLAPLLRGEALAPVPAVTEHGRETRVTTPRFSLLRRPRRARLFDLAEDPGERKNLARDAPAEVAALEALLAAHESRPRDETRAAARTLDAKTLRELEAIGYLRDEPPVSPPP